MTHLPTAQYGGAPSPAWVGEVRYDSRVHLWHPDSPGMRLWVKPCLLRRLRVVRSPFATLGEARWAA